MVTLSSVPSSALVGLVCNFLIYASTELCLQYRTISSYRTALHHPLLVTCGVEIKSVFSDLLRGIFNACPPQKTRPMPKCSLNQVFSFLDSPVFERFETSELIRLLQKTLFFLFLATGRRIGKVSSSSRQFSTHRNYLRLSCVSGFFAQTSYCYFSVSTPCASLL